MVTDLVKGHEGVDVVDLRPGDRDHFSSRVELHGARTKGNHGSVEAHVLGLEVEHVPDSKTKMSWILVCVVCCYFGFARVLEKCAGVHGP
jgi:hypothetical protein